jgi:hypothetical protein
MTGSGGAAPCAADPFGTGALRDRVLAAWAASPARFREDANAEEDLVRGGYRDRVLVELAQNAADAAARAGAPGRLLLRLSGRTLLAANTGSALDPQGVESLSTLRASAKRDEPAGGRTVGRFGVGFAAVLAVSDEPRIASGGSAVRWSAADARAAALAVPALVDEVTRRHGHVPVLRLPWPAEGRPEPGFDTTVALPLRDDGAVALVHRLLSELDDALLLSLPALAEVTVELDGARRVIADRSRWQVLHRTGPLDPALLADRPVEERTATGWSLTWARPLAGQPVPGGVHAPTVTDEPLDLPALLVGTFPLDPSRRHVAPGPLTDFLVQRAAEAYADLAAEAPDGLVLLPPVAMVGALDSALRSAVVAAMARRPVLVADDGTRLRPRDAVSVVGADPSLRAVLAPVLAGLVPDRPGLDRLGARRLEPADVVDLLAGSRREPAWWRTLYDALSRSDVAGEALGALPVPLADGRLVRGPRGLLLPGEGLPPGLDVLGLRVVAEEAAHPLLRRLGAVPAGPRAVLEDMAVQAAVAAGEDLPEPDAVADAVLALVQASGATVQELPWLAEVLLRDADGALAPAGELALPGSLAARVTEPDALGRPATAFVDRWGPDALTAVGVLAGFALVRAGDVVLDDACDHDLADEPEWVDEARAACPGSGLPPLLAELLAVRDLDLVRRDAWPLVLAELAGDPPLRAAVTTPARLRCDDGRSVDVLSYPAWWLRRNATLGGVALTALATPEATDLHGLYDTVDRDVLDVDPAFLAAVGVRVSLDVLLASPGGADDLLERLADPARAVSAEQLARVYAALARLDPDAVTPPERLRTGPGSVVPAADAVVVTSPAHLQLPWPAPPLVVSPADAAALADVLDVATTDDRLDDPAAPEGGTARPVPPEVAVVLGAGTPASWWEHEELTVAGSPVQWWVDGRGRAHACTVDGLARALAWAARRWSARYEVAAVLTDPGRVAEVLAERQLDG